MAFIAMLFAGIAFLLFAIGIGEVILGIVLGIINATRIKKGLKKSRVLSVISVLSFVFAILSFIPLTFMLLSYSDAPNRIVIDGIPYRSGFYGDLYPNFGEVGDVGSDALQEEILYEDGKNEFRRVDFEGHDWVHTYAGKYTAGTVYCAENEWEKMRDYYADASNFIYYGADVAVPEIDTQKFDDLLTWSNENAYNPFDQSVDENTMQNIRRLSRSEYAETFCFYKVSKDGYFSTSRQHTYLVYQGKLLQVLYIDGGANNGGSAEAVVVDVPDELGQYFLGIMELYPK
jgi:hypothetical protein